MSVFNEFKWRDLIYDVTEGLEEIFAKEKITAYIGFDPTADSLHVGSLLPIMALARLQRFGHKPIAIAGGGTGLIGDPSGKVQERQLLTKEQAEVNLLGIKKQLSRFLDFEAKTNPAQIINNADWLTTISLTDFLRDIGKFFTINFMMAKDSVKRRLEKDDGISFTEFSYMLLQAYDFLVLYDRENCTLQMGGSDQWGNITAGIDLIRRLRGGKAYGMVFPLVTTSSGIKFGKTETGTIWLDAQKTSPYRFYQFWLNTGDRDVVQYLKNFTWLAQKEIVELEETVQNAPERREAQKRLAVEVTRIVHGETELSKAQRASDMLFDEEITTLSVTEIFDIFSDVPSSQISRALCSNGIAIVDLITTTGLASSKGEARRLIQGGGIYLNNRRVDDINQTVILSESIADQFLVLRKGRKQFHLVRIVE